MCACVICGRHVEYDYFSASSHISIDIDILYVAFTYRRILPRVIVMRVLAQCSATVELDEELVIVPA